MADDNGGLWAAIGEGFRGMGAVASPAVANRQAEERASTLPNLIRGLQIASATKALEADRAFEAGLRGKSPGTTSASMLEAVNGIDPSVLASSPAAQNYLKQVGKVQQRETLAEQRLQTLALQQQRLELEKGRLERLTGKAPQMRNRISGDQEIQEEWDPSTQTWKEVGKGPRFSTSATGEMGGQPLGKDPNFWYEYFDKTGKLPPIAWGSAGTPTREAFIKGFPEWKKSQGGGGASDTAASQASFKADAGALNAVTKDLNTFEPYKKMLDTNADIAIDLGKKITQSNAQLVNKPLNWLRQNATSNPDVAEYLAQMRFVQTEAARVINNPRIVGQLTDEARKEMDSVVSGNAPIPVVERVLNRLKTDGSNRFNAMRSQQAELMAHMKGDQPKEATKAAGPKVGDKSTSKSGKPIHWDGKQWVYD